MIRISSFVASTTLLLFLCTATGMRSAVYIDEVTFWRDAALKSPAKARPLTMLGYQSQKAGDDEAAKRYFERAVELQPDYPEALNDLAVIYGKSSKRDKALELLQRAVRSAPHSLTFRSNLAMMYYSNGMFDESAHEYTIIIASEPRSPEAAFAQQMLHEMGKAAL